MKKPELLAPAGNLQSFYAAVASGCDAVYLGGKNFGARAFSNNFDNDSILEAVNYAHLYGVKVYVTCNTLIYEDEVEEFMEYIDFLHSSSVDAVILQDIGMLDLIRKTYPNLEIHASTQMHIHNLEGVKLLEKLGVKRVVLARETSIEEIKKIKENTNIDLEIFVSGALCMSYSGQCLMSSLVGNRSGNRGSCSQSCRMKYDLYSDDKKVSDNKYLLSTKDLNTLEYLGELIDIGIDSIKLEGRMKSPEYVYQVASLYRKAITSYYETGKVFIDKEELKKLQIIFNRNFTKGFLFNEKNDLFLNSFRPNHMGINIGEVISYSNNLVTVKLSDSLNRLDGIRIIGDNDSGQTITKMYKNNKSVDSAYKEDIITFNIEGQFKKGNILVKTSDYNLTKEIDNIIKLNQRKVDINIKVICLLNQKIKLIVDDIELTSEDIVESSLKAPISKEKIIEQISKLGNSVYQAKVEVIMDDNIFVRINTLNELKRQMIDLLNNKQLYKIPYKKCKYDITLNSYKEEKGFNVLIKNIEDYELIKNKSIKNIYMYENIYNKINIKNKILALPRVIINHKDYEEELLIGELGSINKYKNIVSDYSLNVVNSYSVAFLNSLGVKRVTLSYELKDYQIKNLIDNYKLRYNELPNLELIVSSIPEVMITKFNLIKYYKIDNGYLLDSFNNKFKIEEDNDLMKIYHYKKIEEDNYNKYFDIGINTLRIHIEDKEDIKKLN